MKKSLKTLFSLIVCAAFPLVASCGVSGASGSFSDPPAESTGSGSVTAPPEKIDYSTYQSFWMTQADYKMMPVCAFNAFATSNGAYYSKDMYSEEHVRWLSEAGFNVAYARESVNDPSYGAIVRETLENCQKYGISYMATVSGADAYTDANILESAVYQSLMKNKPKALGGIMVRDEPSKKMFSSVGKAVETFKEVFSLSRYKGLLYHINLFPNYASASQLSAVEGGEYSYEEYVEDYLESVQPRILSYDYYPCEGEFPNLTDGYFTNMSFIRKKAAEKEIPFWVYIQSCTWGGRERKTTQAENDWQVNTALAYGAKGIQYFCYVTPGLGGEGRFAGGCISREGERTEMYYIAQETNKQIAAVDKILMCGLNRGVIVSGDTPCPIPEEDRLTSYGALSGVEAKHALVGCFDYNGVAAYYVVNNSIEEKDEISLSLNRQASGYLVADGEKQAFSKQDKIEFSLNAGKAILVVLQE